MRGAIAVGPGLVSGGASYSGSRATGDFVSVSQPSGIYAGDGGYDLTVKGNTAFQGGVIASTQAAIDNDRNRLKTGTMTYGDIENYSQFNSSGIHLSGGYTSLHPAMGKSGGSAAAGVSQDSGRIHSATQSSISPGTIIITNEAAQQALTGQTAAEAVAGINRDIRTEAQPQGLSKNWDGPRMLKEREAEASIAAMFGQQASQAAGVLADELAVKARMSADETTAKKWDEGGEYRVALHGGIGALTGGLAGATGAALSAALTPMLGERIASMNLPMEVTEALNVVAATAIGAVANVQGAIAALNQAANNYISRSPFPGVRRTTALENARLLNECGENCTQQDLVRIDRQVAKVEAAANLLAISKRSTLTLKQSEQLTQAVIDLAPGYSNLESLAQMITGRSTLTGEEVSRLWAAVGVFPVGGILKKLGVFSANEIGEIVKKIEISERQERKIEASESLLISREISAPTENIPNKVKSRINLKNEGMEHIAARHLSQKPNASQFSIGEQELRIILQSEAVVKTPISRIIEGSSGIRYIREINVGHPIGVDKFKDWQVTSNITVITDKHGNIVAAFPGELK